MVPFCNEVLIVLHGFAIVSLKKIELVALQVPLLLCDLPVGFLLLRYSVLFTVESLSLLYLLVIS